MFKNSQIEYNAFLKQKLLSCCPFCNKSILDQRDETAACTCKNHIVYCYRILRTKSLNIV